LIDAVQWNYVFRPQEETSAESSDAWWAGSCVSTQHTNMINNIVNTYCIIILLYKKLSLFRGCVICDWRFYFLLHSNLPRNLDKRTTITIGDQTTTVEASDLQKICDLGRGAYGIVEKMRHIPSGTIMAVKVSELMTILYAILNIIQYT